MPMGTYVVLVPIYVLVLVPVQYCNGPAVLCCGAGVISIIIGTQVLIIGKLR